MPPPDLYNSDFYLWTQAQAEALRAAGKGKRGSNSVEWERVAEEMEDMGKRDVKAAMSLCARVLEHLFLLSAATRTEPRGHWRKEVRTLRTDLARELTPTIRNVIETQLETLHREAAAAIADELQTVEPSALPLNQDRRWSLNEILAEKIDPLDKL